MVEELYQTVGTLLRQSITRQWRKSHPLFDENQILDAIKTKLGPFIRSHFKRDFPKEGCLAHLNGADDYQRWSDSIATTPEADEEDKKARGLYRVAFKFLIGFLQSKYYQECLPMLHPTPTTPAPQLLEGNAVEKTIDEHERNKQARQACIETHGCRCAVCGFDFEKTYGPLGKGYIEIHHIIPISRSEHEHAVNPIKDLVPLCANCHAMAHRRGKAALPYTPEELREILHAQGNANGETPA